MLKTFIATILAEALAIYGLVVGLLSIFAIPALTTIEGGTRIFAAGLTMGAASLGAGFGIGAAGSAMASATAEKPDIFSRAVISLILAEALAIYALVTALLLVFGATQRKNRGFRYTIASSKRQLSHRQATRQTQQSAGTPTANCTLRVEVSDGNHRTARRGS